MRQTAAMTAGYQPNRVRGPLNAFGFAAADRALDRLLGPQKARVFADLPDDVVELGPGVGANFRYLRPGARVIAIEPNPAMHPRLRARAEEAGIVLDLRGIAGERIDLDDGSAACVISSLVLCTVASPRQVVAEVLRILQPGGRYAFVEHVAAPEGSRTRRVQRVVRRPWAWCFEGCSCERDLGAVLDGAGFGSVDITRYRLKSPFIPFNTQIAGIAVKAA
jgi:SAM-dependent methyltransferase